MEAAQASVVRADIFHDLVETRDITIRISIWIEIYFVLMTFLGTPRPPRGNNSCCTGGLMLRKQRAYEASATTFGYRRTLK